MGTTYYEIKAKKEHRKYTIKNNNKKTAKQAVNDQTNTSSCYD